MVERFRGSFGQSDASRALQAQLQRTRLTFGKNRPVPRPDLVGRGRLGRASDDRTFANGQRLAEAVGYYVEGVLQRAVAGIKATVITERLSAKAPRYLRNSAGKTKWNKLPLSAGLRKTTGKLQASVRIRAFSPGTNKRNFRGVYRILSQIGGPTLGEFDYAEIWETRGRLQFGRVTGEEYAAILQEIRAGVTQIATQHGATVTYA